VYVSYVSYVQASLVCMYHMYRRRMRYVCIVSIDCDGCGYRVLRWGRCVFMFVCVCVYVCVCMYVYVCVYVCMYDVLCMIYDMVPPSSASLVQVRLVVRVSAKLDQCSIF
jgi:hypothetical protein